MARSIIFVANAFDRESLVKPKTDFLLWGRTIKMLKMHKHLGIAPLLLLFGCGASP